MNATLNPMKIVMFLKILPFPPLPNPIPPLEFIPFLMKDFDREDRHDCYEILEECEGSPSVYRLYDDVEHYEVNELKAAWTYDVDNSFALELFTQLNISATLPQLPASPKLCQSCSNIHILSDDFELHFKLSELQKTAEEPCELCNMFHQFLKPSSGSDRKPIRVHSYRSLKPSGRSDRKLRVYRHESSLKIHNHDRPILRICADPRFRDSPEDIQIGIPILLEAGYPIYFTLLRVWLRVCEQEHGCRPESDGLLPTRVLDVGDDKNPNLLRLYCTSQEERGRYFALSHCWG
jgi:hypothetical protein